MLCFSISRPVKYRSTNRNVKFNGVRTFKIVKVDVILEFFKTATLLQEGSMKDL